MFFKLVPSDLLVMEFNLIITELPVLIFWIGWACSGQSSLTWFPLRLYHRVIHGYDPEIIYYLRLECILIKAQ